MRVEMLDPRTAPVRTAGFYVVREGEHGLDVLRGPYEQENHALAAIKRLGRFVNPEAR
ncbi:hypothetical protein [Anaeromyxobacter terrae]|uniref:hypothetical protein n=1 Tax=Anaeromyxobacter terrae TaxID=2925406 RepID=UPI001F597027|nr:hypothetical protein [Anaeromyxobacter sp. SG22]